MAQTGAQKRAHRKYQQKTNHRFRQMLLAEFGPCSLCGFSDKRALQFDHVAGGGSREKQFRKPIMPAYYVELRARFIAGELQVLCANCNWIKRYEDNEVGMTVWTTGK